VKPLEVLAVRELLRSLSRSILLGCVVIVSVALYRDFKGRPIWDASFGLYVTAVAVGVLMVWGYQRVRKQAMRWPNEAFAILAISVLLIWLLALSFLVL
jgi:hypothetical protein